MLKFTNKRDVDRHVAQMTKNLSENEVNIREKTFLQKKMQIPALVFLKMPDL